jgi:hypothetical protein
MPILKRMEDFNDIWYKQCFSVGHACSSGFLQMPQTWWFALDAGDNHRSTDTIL